VLFEIQAGYKAAAESGEFHEPSDSPIIPYDLLVTIKLIAPSRVSEPSFLNEALTRREHVAMRGRVITRYHAR